MNKQVKNNKRIDTLKRALKVVLGLFIFSLGESTTMRGSTGFTPWGSFSQGISIQTGISFGTAHIIVALIVVCIDLLMKEKIGLGTLLDALLVGIFDDLWLAVIPYKGTDNVALSILFMIIGMFIMSVGQVFYMSGGLSCGPRDTLMVGLGKRLPKLPIGLVDVILKIALVVVSYLIGGPIGLGTLVGMVGIGTSMQIVYHFFKFEPRDIEQEGLIASIKNLFG